MCFREIQLCLEISGDSVQVTPADRSDWAGVRRTHQGVIMVSAHMHMHFTTITEQ